MNTLKRTLILMGTLAFTTTNLFARIGESPGQCKKRYGTLVNVDKKGGRILYSKSGIGIVVHFYEGKADGILYQKIKENILGTPEELSENVISNLLKANAKGWKVKEVLSMDKYWTSESKLEAMYDTTKNQLFITTPGFLSRQADATKKKEDENTSGF